MATVQTRHAVRRSVTIVRVVALQLSPACNPWTVHQTAPTWQTAQYAILVIPHCTRHIVPSGCIPTNKRTYHLARLQFPAATGEAALPSGLVLS